MLLVSACSDSGSSSTVVQDDEEPVSTTVSIGGGVTKGPVAGATINVYAVDENGDKSAEPIATATTDENGQYTIELTDFTGVYIVEATGGTYVDEATGTSKSIPAEAPLRAVSTVETADESTTVTASVTPLTEIATQVAEQKPGGLTADNVTAGNDEVGSLFFGTTEGAGENLLTTTPADITKEDSETASDDERLYGLMVGAISELENQTGSLAEAVSTIANDIAADGNLSDSSDDLVAATNTVISSPTNNSGVTSATKVTNVLTAAASGSGTQVAQSSDAEITGFRFEDTLTRTIDRQQMSISVLQPFDTDLASLADPTIAVSLGATVEPADGEDFTGPVDYVVTAEDGTQVTWTVTVTVAESEASPLANITGATSDLITSIVINNTTHAIVGSVENLPELATLDNTDGSSSYHIPASESTQGQSWTLDRGK
ncbi:MAG: hypothetical protein HUJ31_19340, partial [Pseudomonadales bacterium]|nr:hypothetical protein [Pseudomonadales bacterium]